MLSPEEISTKLDLGALGGVIATMNSVIDANQDGIITLEEILGTLDANKDGFVSKYEFISAFVEMFRIQNQATISGMASKGPKKKTGRRFSLPGFQYDAPSIMIKNNSATGTVSLRTRMEECFTNADVKGFPKRANGTIKELDHVELATNILLSDIVLAVEGLWCSKDETTRIPLRKIAKSCTPDADDRVTLQHFSDQFLSFMRPPKPSEVFAMKTNIRVDQLFDAMDLNSDEQVSKIEFIEFLRSNKPKDGSFNSVARLTEAFNFHRRDVINRDDFHDVFQKLKKELKAEDFQYAFPADDE